MGRIKSSIDHWFVILWTISALWTALTLIAFDIANLISIVLALSLIGIPVALLLGAMPMIFLYLTVAAPAYFMLRRALPLMCMPIALSVPSTLGFILPNLANRALEEDMAKVEASDHGSAIALQPGQKIAYLSNDFIKPSCEEICQRLLFSGRAQEVLIGSNAKARVTRYWIGPAKGPCRAPKLPKIPASDIDLGKDAPYPRPLLLHRLGDIYADGQCLDAGRGDLATADIIFTYHASLRRKSALQIGMYDLGIPSPQIDYVSTQIRSGDHLKEVMRRSSIHAWRLAAPLILNPPADFDVMQMGGWQRGQQIFAGKINVDLIRNFIDEDLKVPGLDGIAM